MIRTSLRKPAAVAALTVALVAAVVAAPVKLDVASLTLTAATAEAGARSGP